MLRFNQNITTPINRVENDGTKKRQETKTNTTQNYLGHFSWFDYDYALPLFQLSSYWPRGPWTPGSPDSVIPGGYRSPVFPGMPWSSLALSHGHHDLLGLSFVCFYFIVSFEFALLTKRFWRSVHSVVVKRNYFTSWWARQENILTKTDWWQW